MAKSDIPLEHIDLEPTLKELIKPSWTNKKTVNAFDTETFNGNVFMLSRYLERKDEPELYHSSFGNRTLRKIQPIEILDFITPSYANRQINVWYNLDYDVSVILGFLPDKKLDELRITGQIELEDKPYRITYLKSKFFCIDDLDKNMRFPHYDISQFFGTSLENAVKGWGEQDKHKLNETIDTSKFSSRPCYEKHKKVDGDCSDCWSSYEAKNYILDNYEKIKRYAERDAEITRDIWLNYIETMENKIGVPMGKPYSTGYVSEMYLHKVLNKKPRFHPVYCGIAWESYAGGRFEVLRRGYFSDVVGVDINSAYPYVMANLPAPTSMKQTKIRNPDIEQLREYDYGFVKAKIKSNPKKNIQPFPVKDEVLKYPILYDFERSVLLDSFLYAVDNDYINSYELIEADLYKEVENTIYPFRFIYDLYDKRTHYKEKIKEKGDKWDKLQYCLKVIYNSMYGKTLQINENMEFHNVDEKEYDFPEHHSLFTMNPYSKENIVIERNPEASRFFNPFFASYITGLTRLKLIETVDELGLHNDVIMFATDCLMIPEIKEKKIKHLLAPKELGAWDIDYRGSAFVIGAGVYDIYNDKDEVIKNVTRGYTSRKLDGTLRELAQKHDKEIPVKIERPVGLFETLQKSDVKSGKFRLFKKNISADMDNKRNWDNKNPDFDELLQDNYDSMPKMIEG